MASETDALNHLLRDIAQTNAVKDIAAAPARDMTLAEAEAELYEHTRYFTVRLERSWQPNQGPRTTEWSVVCSKSAGQPFRHFSNTKLRTAVRHAIDHMTADPLPTSTEVSEQVERFGDDGPCCGGGSQCRCGGGE